MTPSIGAMELLVVLVLALLVMGPKRLPSAGRALGQSLREFRGALTGRGEPLPRPLPAEPTDHR